jgi:hypothetical protein
MSYSFSAKGPTRQAVLDQVKTKLDEVVAGQPIHSNDRNQAYDAVERFLGVLPDNADGMDFSVSVSGSIGWSGNTDNEMITSAGINVSVSRVPS